MFYPGLHAILLHRLAHWLWWRGWQFLASWVAYFSRWLTLIEIHPAARIGRRVFIDHGAGIVVGETADIGDDCTIYQGVTLGGTALHRGVKRHPTLERGVVVGAGAKVLGGFTVGEGARIGSNAVVVKAVPPGFTAIGIPARLINPNGETSQELFSAYGVTAQTDPESQTINALVEIVCQQQEATLNLWRALQALKPDVLPSQPPTCDELLQKLRRIEG